MIDDRHRELGTVLSYLIGRQLRPGEIFEALGISRSAYYLAREEGRLVTADNLLRLGAALGLNRIDLLLRYGLVNEAELTVCARDREQGQTRPRRPRPRDGLQPRPDVPIV